MFNPLETLEKRELFSAVPGIYSNGELLAGERYAVQADANLLPSVRNALDEGVVDIEVVLDPGETYRLKPLDASDARIINDLYLNGDNLTFTAGSEADADGSGGRATLSVEKTAGGERKYPFQIDRTGGGQLELNGIDVVASDQSAGEYIRYVVNYGAGGVTLNDSSIAPARVSGPTRQATETNQTNERVSTTTEEPVAAPDLAFGAAAGIYEDGRLLTDERFTIQSGENIVPSIRRAIDAGHTEILVALDPGEQYFLNPQEEAGLPRINDIYLDGADLTIAAIAEIDADGSGGRADLVVQRNQAGTYNNPFYLDRDGSGNLDLENVDLRAEARREGEFIGFISHYGDGLVRITNSTLEQPTRDFGLDAVVTRTADPVAPVPEVVVEPAGQAPSVLAASPVPVAQAIPTPTPAVAPGPVTEGVGIFLNDGTLLEGYELRSRTNIMQVIRDAMDAGHKDIEVRLDPGETYYFHPVLRPEGGTHNFSLGNISLAGADLRFTAAASADANSSGGYANIEVGPASDGQWSNVFFLGHTSEGQLTLDGISMTMPERTPYDFTDFIVWRGGGELTVVDSKLSGARNNIDVSGFGGSRGQGADVQILRSIVTYSYAPDRDIQYAPGETGGPANGLYARNYNTLLVEDSVFFHNGWRDDAIVNTHGTAYSHGLYLSAGERTSFDPNNTQIINTIFSDNAANAAQLRQGGIVQDSFFFNSPYGINLTAGEISNSAFVSGDAVWPRDGSTTTGYQRWIDRGGHAIQIDQDASIETKRLGPITIQNNVFADATDDVVFQTNRSPILNETDPARPQTLTVTNNYELNWVDYLPGGNGNNYSGEGINRFNTGSTALNGAFGSSFTTVEQIIDAAVNRDRGEYGANGVPEARDLAAFYFQRALEAAG